MQAAIALCGDLRPLVERCPVQLAGVQIREGSQYLRIEPGLFELPRERRGRFDLIGCQRPPKIGRLGGDRLHACDAEADIEAGAGHPVALRGIRLAGGVLAADLLVVGPAYGDRLLCLVHDLHDLAGGESGGCRVDTLVVHRGDGVGGDLLAERGGEVSMEIVAESDRPVADLAVALGGGEYFPCAAWIASNRPMSGRLTRAALKRVQQPGGLRGSNSSTRPRR